MNTGLVKPTLNEENSRLSNENQCDDQLLDILMHLGSRIMKERGKKEGHEALKEQTNKPHKACLPAPEIRYRIVESP